MPTELKALLCQEMYQKFLHKFAILRKLLRMHPDLAPAVVATLSERQGVPGETTFVQQAVAETAVCTTFGEFSYSSTLLMEPAEFDVGTWFSEACLICVWAVTMLTHEGACGVTLVAETTQSDAPPHSIGGWGIESFVGPPNWEVVFRARVVRDAHARLCAIHLGGVLRQTYVLQLLGPPAGPQQCPSPTSRPCPRRPGRSAAGVSACAPAWPPLVVSRLLCGVPRGVPSVSRPASRPWSRWCPSLRHRAVKGHRLVARSSLGCGFPAAGVMGALASWAALRFLGSQGPPAVLCWALRRSLPAPSGVLRVRLGVC